MDFNKSILYFLFLSILTFSACNSDDEGLGGVGGDEEMTRLPYDATKHIYGTSYFINDNEWEMIFDPITGQIDSIPGTMNPAGVISIPSGPTKITSFSRNQRIYIDPSSNQKLTVQDLGTLEYNMIDLKDDDVGAAMIFPQAICFGFNENELFVLDTDKSIWKVNLLTTKVNKVFTSTSGLDFGNVVNFVLSKPGDDFVIIANESIEKESVSKIYLVDANSFELHDEKTIERSFGFVKHPSQQKIFFMNVPTEETGFRLMELDLNNETLIIKAKSNEDLAIDNLSPNLQTIHTQSNTYIVRAGSASIDEEENKLISISLDTGVLINEVEIDNAGIILKIAGE